MAKDARQAEFLGRGLPHIAAIFGVSEQKLKLYTYFYLYINQLFLFSRRILCLHIGIYIFLNYFS